MPSMAARLRSRCPMLGPRTHPPSSPSFAGRRARRRQSPADLRGASRPRPQLTTSRRRGCDRHYQKDENMNDETIPTKGQLDIFGQEFKPVARSGDPETSWQAARSIDEFKMRDMHEKQIELLGLRPGTHEGLMTRYERRWGEPISASGFRTRISELRDAGLVRDSGLRALIKSGRRAIVWELGREESLDIEQLTHLVCPTCNGSGIR